MNDGECMSSGANGLQPPVAVFGFSPGLPGRGQRHSTGSFLFTLFGLILSRYQDIMGKIGNFTLFFLLFSFAALSGCSVFNGQYQTPGTSPATDEEQMDFKEANVLLNARLDDVANGRAKAGETVATPQESAADAQAQTPAAAQQSNENMPTPVIKQNTQYSAVLHTTEGDIEILFTADKTPYTVNNFVFLALKGFYNNTIFHRVIKGFMIQGGDPKGDGTGGPGYQFADEKFEGEYTRGTVAMANSGPDTNGSQFFIMHADYPLQKDYVIFGHVVKGLDVVDKIATAPVTGSGGEQSSPVNPVKITKVDIIEK